MTTKDASLFMETQEIDGTLLIEETEPKRRGNFSMKVALPKEEPAVLVLWKDMSQKEIVAQPDPDPNMENMAMIPMFWVEEDREKMLDMVWFKYDNATKFKVNSGKQKGYVGYLRLK